MDVFAQFAAEIDAAVKALQAQGALPGDAALKGVNVEPPRDPSHGDLATNAAMVLAKPAKQNPRKLAEKLAELLGQADQVARAEVAGPGFINITLKREAWGGVVRDILEKRKDYGRIADGGGEAVHVEYVSANPTGPLHVGHCRGAVFGDALANLLEFSGHQVTREYYINDAGAQVDVLGAFGSSALPRSAGRGDWRHSRGALPRRLSGAGGHSIGQGIRRCVSRFERT